MSTLLGNEAFVVGQLSQEQKRIERAGKLHWFHWLIVAASALLTVLAWYLVKTQVDERIGNQFKRESARVLELVSERMGKYEDALWGGVAAIHAQNQGIDYQEWKRFSETLQLEKKYPGINGIGVIFRKLPEEIAAFLAKERIARPDFKIYPPHDRKELFPITFIEPINMNAAAVGLDMAHETNRYNAAKKARDTGTAQITGPITLVQDAEKTPGFLLYAPFYRGGVYGTVKDRQKHFVGMVYAPFIFKKLMEGTLAKDKRHVGIKIMDGNKILYDENRPAEQDFDSDPMFRKTATVQMFGRAWDFEILSAQSFREAASHDTSWLILAGGIIIDSMLLGLFIVLARSNRRAIQLADKLTAEYHSKSNLLNNKEHVVAQRTVELRQRTDELTESNKALRTSELETKKARQRLLDAFEASPSGMVLFDTNDRLVLFNSTADQMTPYLGRTLEPGMGFADYARLNLESQFPDAPSDEIDEKLSAVTLQHQQLIAEGIPSTVERKFGPDRWIRRTNNRTAEGGSIAILTDISDLKQNQENLEAQARELTRSNEELEQFAYLASHDMQEPLRVIASFCELLQLRYADKLDDDGKEFIAFAVDGARRMRSLLDDLLTYSRIGRSEIEISPVPLTGVMVEIQGRLSSLVKDENAEISFDELPTVRGSQTLLTQLLQNLVVNGIKFHGDEPPRVHVSAEQEDDFWVISVGDNGIGIEPQYADKVFQMFQRLHGRGEYAGNGLGLALCKRAVERHGGDIWIEATETPGTTIKFRLPV